MWSFSKHLILLCVRHEHPPHPRWDEEIARDFIILQKSMKFKTYEVFISGISHLMFWTETAESRTAGKGGLL